MSQLARMSLRMWRYNVPVGTDFSLYVSLELILLCFNALYLFVAFESLFELHLLFYYYYYYFHKFATTKIEKKAMFLL